MHRRQVLRVRLLRSFNGACVDESKTGVQQAWAIASRTRSRDAGHGPSKVNFRDEKEEWLK